ncbi:hypothetical protein CCR85_08995 [Rhodothalassium salexigens]|uniref:flavodoxin family protein n=1 Tax=Rhodothalassium salexigens TaxID=1086 RepID=UPI0019122227|nr:hypothetical protein [Rhodothalassium salexigens]MBK5911624.1 hypothetical protein [Rhodothalassium salexigens]MBK5920917.1 hypothetical protein [Rhodothalassium salexigens]
MAKTALIVYFTMTGETGLLARRLGVALDAAVERIEPRGPAPDRPGLGLATRLRTRAEAIVGLRQPIRPVRLSPADYGLVLIGCPAVLGRVPSPVRQWLSDHGEDLPPAVGFFASTGGPRPEAMFADLARHANRPPLATLAVPRACQGSEREDALMIGFVKDLLPALPLLRQQRVMV